MIENGKKVKIHYTLLVQGELVDTSKNGEPLEYQHGKGQIIPGLERSLEGLKKGDTRSVDIGPEDAYGILDPEAMIQIPKSEIGDEDLEVGMMLAGRNAMGETVKGIIKEIGFDSVTVDFNHPLAGKELHFDIEVIEISE